MTRGAGDISFVAPYVPGLVAVGIRGRVITPGESGLLDSFARQAKRDAVLMERLSRQPVGH